MCKHAMLPLIASKNMLLSTGLLLFFLQASLHAKQLTFERHELLRVVPQSLSQLQFLDSVQQSETELDFWKDPSAVGSPVDIRVPAHLAQRVRKLLGERGIQHRRLVDNVQKFVDEVQQANELARARQDDDFFSAYRTFDELADFLDEKQSSCGSRCEIITFGRSYEGRELRLIKISTGGSGKKAVWLDSGIHAREWIAWSTGFYFIEQLVEGFSADSEIAALFDSYDFYIFPTVNPDGYVFTWETDRYWRKTRSRNETTSCIGADANRNFDFMWRTIGASSNPCSEIYAGSSPNSEPEAKAIAEFITSNVDADWYVYMTLHSFGQLWMTPWGYTTNLPDDYQKMRAAGQVALDALTAVYGTRYTLGSASNVLYPSSGTSRDWAKGVPEFDYVYTVELRPSMPPRADFVLPPEQIVPTGVETFAGFKAMLESIAPGRK